MQKSDHEQIQAILHELLDVLEYRNVDAVSRMQIITAIFKIEQILLPKSVLS